MDVCTISENPLKCCQTKRSIKINERTQAPQGCPAKSAKWICAPSLKTLNTSDKETIAQNWLAHHYSDYATFLCLYVEIIDDNLVGRLTNPAPSKSFRKHKHYTKSNKIIHKHKESQRINRSIKIKWKSQRKTMRQSIRGTQVHFQGMFF